MIPLRDTVRAYRFPAVNWLIISLNVLVFSYEFIMRPGALARFVAAWGMVPANLELLQPLTWIPLLTSIFLHSGWFHLLSNMWTLFIFGDNIEDRMGPARYLAFYLLGGITAGLLQAALMPGSTIPTIGASGAIAAVLGAYFFLYPTARVVTFIPLFFLPWLVEIPALVYLGFWFISQLFSGLASLAATSAANMGGIAWWAHIGGFIFGLLLVGPFAPRRRRPEIYRYPDDFLP